jgi:hypothetical protein
MKTTTKPAAYTPLTAKQRENINWQAKAYRDMQLNFINSASFEAPSAPVVQTCTKSEKVAVLAAASRIKGNGPRNTYTPSKYVMISGIPHKMVDGKLVPLKVK